MHHGTFTRRNRAVLMATAIGIGTAALAFASPATADVLVDQYIEVPQCQPATGQDCPQSPEVRFSALPGTELRPSYTANANGCSDAYVLFKINGNPVSNRLRVSPGQTIVSPNTFSRHGDLVLSVTAQGIEGGCNTGILNSWGGTVRVESTVIPTNAPSPPPGPSLRNNPFDGVPLPFPFPNPNG